MTTSMHHLIDTIFKDTDGAWAIIQIPNILLSAWIILTAVLIFAPHITFHGPLTLLQNAVLFAWAYNEARSGVSYFRKGLGYAVLAVVIVGYFV